MDTYQRVLLVGFRSTGKTSVGKLLAEKLGWQLHDLDGWIEQQSGMSIDALTDQGTDWVRFRELEQQGLAELLGQSHVVIAAGGGVGVNDVPLSVGMNSNALATFGQLNAQTITSADSTLVVGLMAEREQLAQWMREAERAREEKGMQRPILNEQLAQKVQQQLLQASGDPVKQKEIMVEAQVQSNLQILDQRWELYQALTPHYFDTSRHSFTKVAEQVVELVATQVS